MNNIFKLRKLYNKTQCEISDMLDYPKPLYSAFERGAINMPHEKVTRLADYYNVDVNYLLQDVFDSNFE